MSNDTRRQRGRLAAITRHYGKNSSYALEARRDLRFARLREQIAETVDEAPPLTLDQLLELRRLLGGRRR